jgi:hypothetical protein
VAFAAPELATEPTSPRAVAVHAPVGTGGAAAAAAQLSAQRLDITSDPPALVKLDGIALGRTPLINQRVPRGRHEIVFVNDLLGEQLRTSVVVGSALHQRVHADFTSATPQVYVR